GSSSYSRYPCIQFPATLVFSCFSCARAILVLALRPSLFSWSWVNVPRSCCCRMTCTLPLRTDTSTLSCPGYAFTLNLVPSTLVCTSPVLTTKGHSAACSTSKYASPCRVTSRGCPTTN